MGGDTVVILLIIGVVGVLLSFPSREYRRYKRPVRHALRQAVREIGGADEGFLQVYPQFATEAGALTFTHRHQIEPRHPTTVEMSACLEDGALPPFRLITTDPKSEVNPGERTDWLAALVGSQAAYLRAESREAAREYLENTEAGTALTELVALGCYNIEFFGYPVSRPFLNALLDFGTPDRINGAYLRRAHNALLHLLRYPGVQ